MSRPPAADIEAGARLLLRARNPAFLLGPECAEVADQLVELADELDAAVLTTPDAFSMVDASRSAGVFSFGASARARRAVEGADLVLAASSLGEFACRLGEAFAHHTLLHLTECASDVGRNLAPDVALVGPLAGSVAALRKALAALGHSPRRERIRRRERPQRAAAPLARPGYVHPEAAIDALEAALPEHARLCLDVTSGALHAYRRLEVKRGQRIFSSIEQSACMGEALMASLGVRLASGLPTVVLTGDWCFCMAPAELHTAVELELGGYVVVVWANGGGAFIATGVSQQGISVPERVWRWREPPDFSRVAQGYGAEAVLVTDAGALQREVRAGLAKPHPVLVEVRIDPDVPVPAGDRFLSLGTGSGAPTRDT
jgi:acetolactate synthase-1/2/3 large subunit